MPRIGSTIGKKLRAAGAVLAFVLGSVCPVLGLALNSSDACAMSCCASGGLCCHMVQQPSSSDSSPSKRSIDQYRFVGSCPGCCNNAQSSWRIPRADGESVNCLSHGITTATAETDALCSYRQNRPSGSESPRAPPAFQYLQEA